MNDRSPNHESEPFDRREARRQSRAERLGDPSRRSTWMVGLILIILGGLFLTQKLPEGVPSPEFVRPTDGPSEDAALQQLADAVRAFESKLARERTGAPTRWPVHPVLGPMRGRDWLAFHDLHARHHFKFMKAHQHSNC